MEHRNAGRLVLVVLGTLWVCQIGCSLNTLAVNVVSDALAAGGTTFASDDDPELIRQATPFSLKLTESLLAQNPRHQGLLLAAVRGFAQYTYAFVQQEADEWLNHDLDRAISARSRAKRLYLRARDYGLRGLEVRHSGLAAELRVNPLEALRRARVPDVPLIYWTAASWAGAISLAKDDIDLMADLPIVESLIDRALALDEDYDDGAIHTFLISYEMASRRFPDAVDRAREHFRRAMALGGPHRAGPLVAAAESLALVQQDRSWFAQLLRRALAIDPDARPPCRLVNMIYQRRARWLLGQIDELFLGPPPPIDQEQGTSKP